MNARNVSARRSLLPPDSYIRRSSSRGALGAREKIAKGTPDGSCVTSSGRKSVGIGDTEATSRASAATSGCVIDLVLSTCA